MECELIVREILRLRAVQQQVESSLGSELERTIDALSELAGRSVKRSVAARLLGVSQTALGKWIATGEVGVIQTPSGRTQIPLLELLELLEELPLGEGCARPLSAALKRRRTGDQLDADLIPRRPNGVVDDHRRAELQALAFHRAAARDIDERGVSQARIRLERWERGGHIDPRWAAQWHRILEQPVGRIAELIAEDTPAAADLRQTSPFAGSLSERERREILQAVHRAVL